MLRKVRVKLPKAQSGIEARMKDLYTRKDLQKAVELNEFGTKPIEASRSLTSVPREKANLEAEGGETAVTNFNNDGIPEQYIIKGPRHSSGGVPLKLKEDSFIFSDTRSMKIRDPKILNAFGMGKKAGGYTPAQIAKKYDLNKYKKILLDPESDNIQKETAELMISNYNHKLAQLALFQESMKGFPQGIPQMAIPYLSNMQLDPEMVLGLNKDQEQGPPQQQSMSFDQGQEESPMQEDQGEARYGKNIISKLKQAKYGFSKKPLKKFYPGGPNGNPNNPGAQAYDEMYTMDGRDYGLPRKINTMQEMNVEDPDLPAFERVEEPDPYFKTKVTGKLKRRDPYRAEKILTSGSIINKALSNLSEQGNIESADIKTSFAEGHRRGLKAGEVNRGKWDPNQGGIDPSNMTTGMYGDTYTKYGGSSSPNKRLVRIKLPKASMGYNFTNYNQFGGTYPVPGFTGPGLPKADKGLLTPRSYEAIDIFEDTKGTAQGTSMGKGMGYAKTKEKEIKKFIEGTIGMDAWNKLPENLKLQTYSFMFNHGTNPNVWKGLAQAIDFDKYASGDVDMDEARRGIKPEEAIERIKNAKIDDNVYNNYINQVLPMQYQGIADYYDPNKTVDSQEAFRKYGTYTTPELFEQGQAAYRNTWKNRASDIDKIYNNIQATDDNTTTNNTTTNTTTNTENKTPVTSNKTTKVQNIPKDATKHYEASTTYDPSKLKVGDYVKGKDGKYRKVKGFTGGGLSGGSMSGPDNYQKFYGTNIKDDVDKAKKLLEIKAKDPNSGITLKNGKYHFSGKASQSLTLAEQELITKIAGYQGSSGYGAKEYGLELGDQYKNEKGFWGYANPELIEYQYWKSKKPNRNLTTADFQTLSPEARKANRVDYLKKLGYTDDELLKLKDKLDDPNKLYTDSFVNGKGKKTVNGVTVGDDASLVGRVQKSFKREQFRPMLKDDYNFGWEHADFYTEEDPTVEFEDVPEEILTKDEKDKGRNELLIKPSRSADAPFFLQDVISTAGAARDLMNVKKYMPWQASWNLNIPEPVYYDPTRELAANAEMANIGTQGAQLFAGPQAYNARFSQIQGQAAKNAADILSRYNNLNVGIANQYEVQKAQLLNQDEMARANAATNLFDKTTIANEMYDAQRNKARENMRNAYKDAITNRANAQVMNTLYPQYNTDPMSGGMMTFMGGRDLDENATEPEDVMTKMDSLRKLHPGWTDEMYRKAAMGESDDDGGSDEYMRRYANMMRGV
jgi:hypothetical protein